MGTSHYKKYCCQLIAQSHLQYTVFHNSSYCSHQAPCSILYSLRHRQSKKFHLRTYILFQGSRNLAHFHGSVSSISKAEPCLEASPLLAEAYLQSSTAHRGSIQASLQGSTTSGASFPCYSHFYLLISSCMVTWKGKVWYILLRKGSQCYLRQ